MTTSFFVLNIAVLLFSEIAAHKTRIIGGTEATAGQFPYAAAIHVKTANSAFFCGGVLTGSQWILTSANCVNNGVLFTIQLGSTTLTEEDPDRITVESSEYYVHPDFNPETIEADVGLIKLKSVVTENDYIKSVSYLLTNATIVSPCRILGWGQTSDSDADLSEHLRYVDVRTLTTQECREIYGDQITSDMLCVRGNTTEGTCTGDNGGPLFIGEGSVGLLIGIASFISGNGCENTDPSGFTNIFSYYDWISSLV